MSNVERVIRGLECCLPMTTRNGLADCKKCPYDRKITLEGGLTECCHDLMADALALLKAQEPKVMTLGDLRSIGSVWELNTPPYLWMEINPSYRWTRGFWVAWREIYDMIDGLHPTYDADNYQKIWRCLASRPTDEQREAVKWE